MLYQNPVKKQRTEIVTNVAKVIKAQLKNKLIALCIYKDPIPGLENQLTLWIWIRPEKTRSQKING